jgi:hypothetical protein
MLPQALGLSISRLTEWIAKPVGVLANVLLLGLIVATQYETLAAIRFRGCKDTSLLLADLAIGWVCGEPDVAIRKALAVTTAARSAAVELVSVASNFAGTPAVTAVVTYALVSILGVLGFSVLSGKVAAKEMLLHSRARRS